MGYRSNRLCRLLFCLLLAIPGVSLAQAPATDDAYTIANSRSNSGASGSLVVQSPGINTWLKFDVLSRLPAGTTGSEIAKATVRLYVSGVTHSGSFNVYRVTGSWNESSITAQNAPSYQSGLPEVSNVMISTTQRNDYIVFDITAQAGQHPMPRPFVSSG